jgi:hypothetical protein
LPLILFMASWRRRDVLSVGWAKARRAVPTTFLKKLVGTLRFAHPTHGNERDDKTS